MSAFTPELLAVLASMVVAGIVWLVRLEGRVNVHDRELELVSDTHDKEFQQLREDLKYIRDRIDAVLGVGR